MKIGRFLAGPVLTTSVRLALLIELKLRAFVEALNAAPRLQLAGERYMWV